MRRLLVAIIFLTTTVVRADNSLSPISPTSTEATPIAPPNLYPTPTTTISAPTNVKYGKLIKVEAIIPDKVDHLSQVGYIWRVYPPVDDLFTMSDNRVAWFGAGIEPVEYTVELIASYLFVKHDPEPNGPVVDFAQRVTVVTKTVTVGSGTPTPPEPPEPPPGPTPPIVVPDSKYGLTKLAYTWATSVNVPAAQRKQDAGRLAASFRTQAARADWPDISTLLAATKASNNTALPTTGSQWKSNFFTPLKQTLDNLKLPDIAAHLEAWNEIVDGLVLASK